MSRRVLVVAKAPAPGRAKTRLVPPLTPEGAAELQTALLLDTLDACRAQADAVAMLAPEEDRAALALLAPDVPVVAQEGRGLADALRMGLARHADGGGVAIVSSDIPGVPAGAVSRAFAHLEGGADLVLGPALDGGYWLVAARAPHDAPFRDIPWSTPACCAVTARRGRDAGLDVRETDRWRDLDTLADLAALAGDGILAGAPRTAAALARVRAAGLLPEARPPDLVASELVLGTPWRSVLADRLADGPREAEYVYMAVPRAVFVVAVTPDRRMALVRQYRHPVRDFTLEVPAGSVGDGESPREAAARELAEEAGGRARRWRHLSTFFSSSAHLSLRSDAFLATGVELTTPSPDEHEDLSLVLMPVAEAIDRARTGGFAEGQTALAILLAAPHLEGAPGPHDHPPPGGPS